MTAQKTDQELWEWIEQNIDMKEIMENHMINTLGFHYALMTHITDWLRINQHAIDEILETAKAAHRDAQTRLAATQARVDEELQALALRAAGVR